MFVYTHIHVEYDIYIAIQKLCLTGCSCSLQPKFDGDHGAELFGRPQLHLRGHRVQDLRLRQGVNILDRVDCSGKSTCLSGLNARSTPVA